MTRYKINCILATPFVVNKQFPTPSSISNTSKAVALGKIEIGNVPMHSNASFPMCQLHRFTNFIVVPLSGTTRIAFWGACAKLSNVRILKICDGTLPYVPNCSLTHMKILSDSGYGSAGKFTINTMSLQLK